MIVLQEHLSCATLTSCTQIAQRAVTWWTLTCSAVTWWALTCSAVTWWTLTCSAVTWWTLTCSARWRHVDGRLRERRNRFSHCLTPYVCCGAADQHNKGTKYPTNRNRGTHAHIDTAFTNLLMATHLIDRWGSKFELATTCILLKITHAAVIKNSIQIRIGYESVNSEV